MFNDNYGLTKAVLDGKKTQTRRIINPQPTYQDNCGICWKGYAYGLNFDNPYGSYRNFVTGTEYNKSCRRYRKGEIIAVAQSYRDCGGFNEQGLPKWQIIAQSVKGNNHGWDNKMFVRADLMPYRIKITGVRVERLQDITEEDCLKEGIIKGQCGSENTHFMDAYYIPNGIQPYCTAREAYSVLIDKISGNGTWERNPYVWVYDFELSKQPIIVF